MRYLPGRPWGPPPPNSELPRVRVKIPLTPALRNSWAQYICLWTHFSAVPSFARPIPSVYLSGRSGVAYTAKTARDIDLYLLWRSYRKSYPGYLGDESPTPYDHPFHPNWGLATPSQNLHRKLRPTVPDTRVVCTGRLYGNYNYQFATQRHHRRPHRGTHSPIIGGNQNHNKHGAL